MFAYDLLKWVGGVVLLLNACGFVAIARYHSVKAHKAFQILASILLLPSLLVFEFHVRSQDWRHLAGDSPFFDTYLYPLLMLHLLFAVPCVLFWLLSLYAAVFSVKVGGVSHKALGRLTMLAFIATYMSGLLFYRLAFMSN
jgi:putative membrane protein